MPSFAARYLRLCVTPVIVLTALWLGSLPVLAQDSDSTGATVTGLIEEGGAVAYRVSDLQAGDTLYIYAQTTDGNLDPVLYVLPGDADILAVSEHMYSAAREADVRGDNALTAFGEAAEEVTFAWDDDSGAGHDATLALEIPEDSDYLIVVDANISKPTAGEFQLLVGVNAPEIAEGTLAAPQSLMVELNEYAPIAAIQEIIGTLTLTQPEKVHRLGALLIGDTLTAFVESTTNEQAPRLILEDYSSKALATNNLLGTQSSATIEYTFTENPLNYRLRVVTPPDGGRNESDYRLLLGLNSPDALTGETESHGPPILHEPIPVTVTLQIDQITDVDQQAENFGIVANVLLEWHDPAFAFDPDSCHCDVKRFRSQRAINSYLTENDINVFPEILFFNQQAGRTTQELLLRISADGSVTYFERFAATLQAPDFNFRQFPFDTQQFYVRSQSLFGRDFFTLAPDTVRSGFGAQLGEEEWIFSNDEFTTDVIDYKARDQVVFGFTTHRHLNFYIFRFLLPILVIIFISWITFFLNDYTRRIEVTGANLLLFIAYNFTISADLPRIGYLTFMDIILISTFVVSGLVLAVNIWFRKLERDGREEVAAKWDPVLIWAYPLLYILGGAVVYLIFFPPVTSG